MKLSLLVVYRNRKSHLESQISWWKAQAAIKATSNYEVIIIEADYNPSSWIQSEIIGTNIRYEFLYCPGVLHKTKALNLGLKLCQGKFVAPFDVDLIPTKDTLEKHWKLAEASPLLLVTGYRVMSHLSEVRYDKVDNALEESTIACEDQPSALWKHIVKGERFGVVPLFERTRLLNIEGWDETFIGWGAEDQDIIERYLQGEKFLCRCPNLVYLHLYHKLEKQWSEKSYIEANRDYYYYQKTTENKNFDT